MFYTNKHVSIIGFGLASTEIILGSTPVGYTNTLYRYGQLMGPMFAVTSTFCLVTYVSTKIRGKDDELNYAIGGFVAGSIMGPVLKQGLLGMWIGVGCAIIGAVKKHSKINGYEFFPTYPEVRQSVHGDFKTPYRHWTVFDARPKGWIAAEERQE